MGLFCFVFMYIRIYSWFHEYRDRLKNFELYTLNECSWLYVYYSFIQLFKIILSIKNKKIIIRGRFIEHLTHTWYCAWSSTNTVSFDPHPSPFEFRTIIIPKYLHRGKSVELALSLYPTELQICWPCNFGKLIHQFLSLLICEIELVIIISISWVVSKAKWDSSRKMFKTVLSMH